MENIHVRLPDGQTVEVRRGTRIDEIGSGHRADGDIIAAKVDGRPVDLNRPVEQDCFLEWISIAKSFPRHPGDYRSDYRRWVLLRF